MQSQAGYSLNSTEVLRERNSRPLEIPNVLILIELLGIWSYSFSQFHPRNASFSGSFVEMI